MAAQVRSDGAQRLALPMVASSGPPLLLLDGQSNLAAASTSFSHDLQIDVSDGIGQPIFALAEGQWDTPALHRLL